MRTAASRRMLVRVLIVAALIQTISLVGVYIAIGNESPWPPNVVNSSVLFWPVVLIFASVGMIGGRDREVRRRAMWLLGWSTASFAAFVLGMMDVLGADGAVILPLAMNLPMIGAAIYAAGAVHAEARI